MINRVVQSGGLEIGGGDRLQFELEFTGQKYNSAHFADEIESGLIENWHTLVSKGVVRDVASHKSYKIAEIRFNKFVKTDNDVIEKREILENRRDDRSVIVELGGKKSAEINDFAKKIVDPIYDKASGEIEGSIRRAREEAAARLLPEFKAAMQRQNFNTYDNKKTLVKWVNDELRRFDLAIKSPKTGLPATLKAKPGNHPEIGSFELKSDDVHGGTKTFSTPSLAVLLENFELMEASPRREPLAEWHDRVKQQRGGPRRA